MGARITRGAAAPPYSPPLHTGVDAKRLQGHEAGPTETFWVGLSDYSPGSMAEKSPAAQETVYFVVEGELTLTTCDGDPVTEVLRAGDSVHLPKGTVREVRNLSGAQARLLVVIAHPADVSP